MQKERYSFEKLELEIANKTPKEKINIIRSYLDTYNKWKYYEDGKDYTGQLFHYEFYGKANELLAQLEADKSIAYSHDLNYYFNAVNIPNQDAIFATKEFIEHNKADVFEPLFFFNLLFRQIDWLKDSLDKPIDFIAHLKTLPFNDEQKHLLFGMILYWHGGYPANNMNPQYKTILKLIEKEFLAQFPENLTIEKQFCSNTKERKLVAEAELISNDIINKNQVYNISGSKYLSRVNIDFEGLPQYVVHKGIIMRFENQRLLKDNDYNDWQNNWVNFLQTIPEQYIKLTVEKGIEYGKKAYEVHLKNECNKPESCLYNESWERRISMAEYLLRKMQGVVKEDKTKEVEHETELIPDEVNNMDITTARQVLALHYIFEYCQINNVDNTAKARFIQFLTGKETGAKTIKNTTIYKRVRSPFSEDDKSLIADLQYIRKYFEDLGFSKIAEAITKEINTKTK